MTFGATRRALLHGLPRVCKGDVTGLLVAHSRPHATIRSADAPMRRDAGANYMSSAFALPSFLAGSASTS